MARNVSINVDFLTRVEGHGHIVIDVTGGVLRRVELQVVEAPRLFEAMLQGRSIFEAQHITSRICGICSCSHSLAAIQAAENAIGLIPSEQTLLLRKLLLAVEFLDSHLLHIYFLIAPDMLGAKSFVGLMDSYSAHVRRALQMKKYCHDICCLLVGRHVHPISCVVGGFTKLPRRGELETLRRLLLQLDSELEMTVALVADFQFPEFSRETEYVALASDVEGYPLLTGDIASSDGVRSTKENYQKISNEYQAPHSSAKRAKLSRNSYAVGALARFNLNGAKLHPQAKQVAQRLGLLASCYNPFLNSVAQLVECVHCAAEALQLVDQLIDRGVNQQEQMSAGANEIRTIKTRAGHGVGAIEAPRGTLFHHYIVDEKGIIQHADCVIPTSQNLQNIEDDMHKLVSEIITSSEAEITQMLEMLVRAYDPCISCSTH